MARGRKALVDPPVRWRLDVPLSLATKVELALFDPALGQIRYGSRAQLLLELLSNWIEGKLSHTHEMRVARAKLIRTIEHLLDKKLLAPGLDEILRSAYIEYLDKSQLARPKTQQERIGEDGLEPSV